MKTSRHLAPYNYLATSMNYWRIFMPGTDAGVSVRCEVYSFLKDGQRLSLPGALSGRAAGYWRSTAQPEAEARHTCCTSSAFRCPQI